MTSDNNVSVSEEDTLHYSSSFTTGAGAGCPLFSDYYFTSAVLSVPNPGCPIELGGIN